MAPNHADPAPSDEEDAPETISLVQSKRTAQQQDDKLKEFHAAEKEKKNAKNRERDRKLKERAGATRGKGKEVIDVEDDVEARMERAMREAQEEMDEGSEGDEDLQEFEMDAEVSGESGEDEESEDEDSDEGDEDEEMASEESEDEEMLMAPLPKSKSNPNHLPDHLFTSAFTSQKSSSTKPQLPNDASQKRKSRKRLHHSRAPKDLIIGSRAIRTLADTSRHPSAASTVPLRKVRKFVDRSLGLKGGNLKGRGWQRKPANIGVLKRDGPAANFVRTL